MKLFTYLATSFISSLLFIYLIILYSLGSFAVFELMDLLIALWVFVFPLFLVGGFIVGVIALCFQNFFDFKKYVPALILFIVVGILLNFFCTWALVKKRLGRWDNPILGFRRFRFRSLFSYLAVIE